MAFTNSGQRQEKSNFIIRFLSFDLDNQLNCLYIFEDTSPGELDQTAYPLQMSELEARKPWPEIKRVFS